MHSLFDQNVAHFSRLNPSIVINELGLIVLPNK